MNKDDNWYNAFILEISLEDFKEHIEDEDFFLEYGNPVLLRMDNGFKAIYMAWPMCERIMREAGRGDELDEINRPIIREHDSE